MKVRATVVAAGITTLFVLAACQGGNDAPVVNGDEAGDQTPASILAMPDGFSNIASKCDPWGNRVYVIYHSDAHYGSIAVLPHDKSCIQSGESGAENEPG